MREYIEAIRHYAQCEELYKRAKKRVKEAAREEESARNAVANGE